MTDDHGDGDTESEGDGSNSDVMDLEEQLVAGIEELKTGDPERAIDVFSRVALQARAGDLPLMEASACGMLGQALLIIGQREEGLPYANRALEIAEQVGNEEAAENFRELVLALSSPDEPADAEDQSEGEEILDALNSRIRTAMDQAMTGDPAGAVDELVNIAEEAQKVGAPGPEASAQIAIGQLLLASGNRDLAVISLRRALAIATELENEGAVAHIRELLERAP